LSRSDASRVPHAGPALTASSIALACLLAIPLLYLLLRAWQASGTGALDGLNQRALGVVWRSVSLSGGVAAICVLLSLPLAWLITVTDLPWRRTIGVLLTLPLAIPSYVSGFVIVAAFGPAGWLADRGVSLPEVQGGFGATLALLFVYPYVLLPLMAGVRSIDPQQWHAALSLGCRPFEAWRRVILPQLRPAIASGGLLVALYVLSDFGAVSLTRFRSLSYVIYLRYQTLFGREEAYLYGIALVLIAVALLLLRRFVAGRALTGSTLHSWPTVRLGIWRWPAFVFCLSVIAYAVVLPVAVVAFWWWRGVNNGAPIHPFADAIWNTVAVGVAGAVLVVACAYLPALYRRFGSARASLPVWAASHVGFALPGIVVALALVALASQHLPSVYQTVPLLLFAYVVRFVPIAAGSLHDTLSAQDPHLLDAAQSLGRTRAQALRAVVLPLTRPTAWVALLAAFVSIIKELPATLLLAPLEFETLATHIWAQTEEAFFTSVAPPVLLLVSIAAIVGALAVSRESAR
jgi:iron(III) transport system permease protein